MPDLAATTPQTVEYWDIPAPIGNLVRLVGIQWKKVVDWDFWWLVSNTQERLWDILLDFGYHAEGFLNLQHSQEISVWALQAAVLEAYKKCIQEPRPKHTTTIVVPRTLAQKSDVRVALNALRQSRTYNEFKHIKIWRLPHTQAREKLTEAFCSVDANWYTILCRIFRFNNPGAMSWTGAIQSQPLRDFLCDYVFCVPREEWEDTNTLPRKPRIPKKPEGLDETDDLVWIFFHGNESVTAVTETLQLARLCDISEKECTSRLMKLGLIPWGEVRKKRPYTKRTPRIKLTEPESTVDIIRPASFIEDTTVAPDADTESGDWVSPESSPALAPPEKPLRIRPAHSDIPAHIASYEWLVSWLQEEWQVSLVHSLKNTLGWAKARLTAHRSLEAMIFWDFGIGRIEPIILQLVKFFDPQKELADFIAELREYKAPEKPKVQIPVPRAVPAPPVLPRTITPVPATVHLTVFGILVPTQKSYEWFLAWSRGQTNIVQTLHDFCTDFLALSGTIRAPGSMDIVKKFGSNSEMWKFLTEGARLKGSVTDMWQVALDIAQIDLSTLHVAAAPSPNPVTPSPVPEEPPTPEKILQRTPPLARVVQKSLEDQMLDLMMEAEENKVGMRYVRPIADAYMNGEYKRAGDEYEKFKALEWKDDEPDDSENNAAVSLYNTLLELKKKRHEAQQPVSILGLILELCGYEFEEDPLCDYKIEHHWEKRLGQLLVDSGVTSEQLQAWLNQPTVSDLIGALRQIQINIPLGCTKWLQWQEKASLETNLAQFMESLIAHDHLWEKKWSWQIDIKELKKKLRHIKFPEPEGEAE